MEEKEDDLRDSPEWTFQGVIDAYDLGYRDGMCTDRHAKVNPWISKEWTSVVLGMSRNRLYAYAYREGSADGQNWEYYGRHIADMLKEITNGHQRNPA